MLVREFWKIPFLRLIIPFLAGIVIADIFELNPYFCLGICIIFIAISIIFGPFLNHKLSYHKRWVFGVWLSIAILLCGSYLTSYNKQYSTDIAESEQIIGTVFDCPQIGPTMVKFPLKVKSYFLDNAWQASEDLIMLTIEKDSLSSLLEYGNLLLIEGNLKKIRNAGNPAEFDYKKYLERKHIHFKSYQNKEEWFLLEKNSGNALFAFAYRARNNLLDIYRKAGISGDEFGLLAALTLGAKDYLSDEIIEAYSGSGAMHVLSVSGLHVGIIFIVLNQLLFFLRKNRKWVVLQAFIIILTIWFFALLTGLSPSVNRSAAMITFVIIGKASMKKPSAYNSVAASAFILLFIDPLFLFDVGFQLSFLAVISLIFFYQRLYLLIEVKNYFLDKIWALTCVSIAAQIGTTALSIYYFHQFPVYAILSNLIVVPASFVVMVLAIILLATSFILPVAKFIASILSASISLLNGSTKFVEQLPMSTIKNIPLNGIETLLLHAFLILLMIYIVNINKKTLLLALFSLVLVFTFRDIRFIRQKSTERFSVYNVSGKSAFSIHQDGRLKLFVDSGLYSDLKTINYLTSNIMSSSFISAFDVEKTESSMLIRTDSDKNNVLKYYFSLNNMKFVFLHNDICRFESSGRLSVDVIVVSKNSPSDVSKIRKLFEFQELVADASVPKWKLEKLKKDCQKLEIPFYNVSESGAYLHLIPR